MLNLHRAAVENRAEELKGRVLGLSVAVMNALDAAFNQGQGQILETWLQAMDSQGAGPDPERTERRAALSPGAKAFFMGLPRTKKD